MVCKYNNVFIFYNDCVIYCINFIINMYLYFCNVECYGEIKIIVLLYLDDFYL